MKEMLGLNTQKDCLKYVVKEYMLRKSKGLGFTEEEKEIKMENMRNMISNKFTPEQTENTLKMMKKFYEFVGKSDINREIESGKVSTDYLIELFERKFLKEGKEGQRSEEISDEQEQLDGNKKSTNSVIQGLKDDGIIARNERLQPKIEFSSKQDGVVHEFMGSEDRTISIQEIGRLNYTHSINMEDNITKYRITVRSASGQMTERDVYSNINQMKMSDGEYKRAVLEGLLSSHNLDDLSYDGYIGDIIKRAKAENEKDDQVINGEFTHRISENYVLRYTAEDLTAVSMYEQKRKIGLMNSSKKVAEDDRGKSENIEQKEIM